MLPLHLIVPPLPFVRHPRHAFVVALALVVLVEQLPVLPLHSIVFSLPFIRRHSHAFVATLELTQLDAVAGFQLRQLDQRLAQLVLDL